MPKVHSSLLVAVMSVSMVVGSVIHQRDNTHQGRYFIPDVAGRILSFCSFADWFRLQRVDLVFRELIRQAEITLGEWPSSDPTGYRAFQERALNTPGMRCAVLCGDLPIAVMNGGTILDESDKQQYLAESTEKIDKLRKSPNLNLKWPDFLISESMMVTQKWKEVEVWEFDSKKQKHTLMAKYPIPFGSEYSLRAAVLGNDDSLKLVFIGLVSPKAVLTLDVRTMKSRLMKFGRSEAFIKISSDGSFVCFTNRMNQITVLNNPVMSPLISDEVFEWKQVRRRFLRFEVSVPGVLADISARISPDNNYAMLRTVDKRDYLMNLASGETTRIVGSMAEWIGDGFFHVSKDKVLSLQNVQHPNVDITTDQSILDGVRPIPRRILKS